MEKMFDVWETKMHVEDGLQLITYPTPFCTTTFNVGVNQLGCLRRIWAREVSFFVRDPELG